MVPAAVDLSVLVEIDQVDQQLAARGTLEALRVPTAAVPGSTGKHSYVSTADLSATLEKYIWSGGWRCGAEGRKLDDTSFNKWLMLQVEQKFAYTSL